MKILLVEDDEATAQALSHALSEQNYLVEVADDGKAGWELAEAFEYDLILLDVILPYLDGITFCKQLRAKGSRTPVLLLTARDTSADKIIGLDSGADDYIVKPINIQELSARIRAVLRRGTTTLAPILEWGELRLDPSNCEVTYENRPISLTPKEYSLLELFLRNPNRVFSRNALLENLWSFQEPPGDDTVRAHIKGLRQKLKSAGAKADLIDTVYGLGYRLKPQSEEKNVKTATPPTTKEKSPTQEKVDAAMSNVWLRCQGKFIEQVEFLEQITIAWEQQKLDSEMRQKAKQAAHKLAGSLGMFGFVEGSQLTRELEKTFEDEKPLVQTQAKYYHQQLINLRQELQQTRSEKTTSEPVLPALNEQLPVLLLVVNDPKLAEAVTVEAQNKGIQVEVAKNPAEARKNIARSRPNVVLLDLAPDTSEDGLKLLTELSNQCPPIPVLVFNVRDSFDERIKVARLGGRGFLNKTMPTAQVLEMVLNIQQQTRATESKVMILDDDSVVLMTLRSLLEPWGIGVITLDNPLKFWDTLEESVPDLLILDVEMPQLSGIELCQVVRNDPRWNQLPVLFLTAHTDADTVHRVFTAGADDYVSKPIVGPELMTRILNRLERSQLLRNLAENDALTKVANRRKSTQDLNRFLSLAKRYQQPLSLAILDLDFFKKINDSYGHSCGDRVLSRFGEILQQSFRSEDVVARWGGEEFVVGMYGMSKSEAMRRLVELRETWQQVQLVDSNGTKFKATFSAGIAQFPDDGTNLQELYRTADGALYLAKDQGRDRIILT